MSKTTRVYGYGSKFKHKFDGEGNDGASHDEYRQRKKEKRLKSMLRTKNFSRESFSDDE